jgi:CheY-like chemotaxis protein
VPISAHTPILLVEDSPEDCEATMRAIRKSKLPNPVVHCASGDLALDYLHREGAYTDPKISPRPSLILLDLNLPGTDGRQVLEEIKKDRLLRTIPVIVFTTSSDRRDIAACYRAGANSYIQKPVDLAGLVTAIQRIRDFWFEVVSVPTTEDLS